MVTRGTPQPPSQQLASLLRAKIESGELAPGTALPSIVKLATEHQVAPTPCRRPCASSKTRA